MHDIATKPKVLKICVRTNHFLNSKSHFVELWFEIWKNMRLMCLQKKNAPSVINTRIKMHERFASRNPSCKSVELTSTFLCTLRYYIPSEEEPWFSLGEEAWKVEIMLSALNRKTLVHRKVYAFWRLICLMVSESSYEASESSYETETVMIDRQDEDETAETMEKWLSQATGHNPKSSTLAVAVHWCDRWKLRWRACQGLTSAFKLQVQMWIWMNLSICWQWQQLESVGRNKNQLDRIWKLVNAVLACLMRLIYFGDLVPFLPTDLLVPPPSLRVCFIFIFFPEANLSQQVFVVLIPKMMLWEMTASLSLNIGRDAEVIWYAVLAASGSYVFRPPSFQISFDLNS